MEETHSKIINESVAVTWHRKRFWTSSKVFLGVVVVAVTALAITLRYLSKSTD